MDLAVQQLPGVGWTLEKKLAELKIQTVADVRASGKAYLQRELGDKTGEQLWRSAHGRDDREVEPIQMRK
jgi:DNA repair protein REV1